MKGEMLSCGNVINSNDGSAMEGFCFKPKLTPAQQVGRMEEKGITFGIVSKSDAESFLAANSNYFKMASYRTLYQKSSAEDGIERYENLDFGHLVDLFEIDCALRRVLLSMTLDIEADAKVGLLRKVDLSDEDGYEVVSDYVESLSTPSRKRLEGGIRQKRNDVYCGDVVKKYDGRMPVWAFLEVVSFGDFNAFYKFCAERWGDDAMTKGHYRLKMVKCVRNACAHGNCIVNGFSNGSCTAFRTPPEVANLLSENGIGRRARRRSLSNPRLQQIAVLCFTHRSLSHGGEEDEDGAVDNFLERMHLHDSYYERNMAVRASFEFLEKTLTLAVSRS